MNTLSHVAILPYGPHAWHAHDEPAFEYYNKLFAHALDVLKWQIAGKIPIVTLLLVPDNFKEKEDFAAITSAITSFCDMILGDDRIAKQQIKVSIFGKWYDLPGRTVEAIKAVIDDTKDYDHLFFNICINYSGKQEIVDAAKIISLKVMSGKATMNTVDEDMLKDTMYSSSFLPPDLVIKTGGTKSLHGFLLYDTTDSHIIFCKKNWLQFNQKDFEKIIAEWKEEEDRVQK